jgi:hypothetical protein
VRGPKRSSRPGIAPWTRATAVASVRSCGWYITQAARPPPARRRWSEALAIARTRKHRTGVASGLSAAAGSNFPADPDPGSTPHLGRTRWGSIYTAFTVWSRSAPTCAHPDGRGPLDLARLRLLDVVDPNVLTSAVGGVASGPGGCGRVAPRGPAASARERTGVPRCGERLISRGGSRGRSRPSRRARGAARGALTEDEHVLDSSMTGIARVWTEIAGQSEGRRALARLCAGGRSENVRRTCLPAPGDPLLRRARRRGGACAHR